MPRTSAISRGCAAARLSTAAIAASTQASGSCSEKSGAGCDSERPHDAVATIAPTSFTSTAFTPDVPTSIPRYTPIPPCGCPCCGQSALPSLHGIPCFLLLAGRCRRARAAAADALRQIVPHHDVDPDLVLFAEHRLGPHQRKQRAHASARLMPRILRDHSIHDTLQ